MNDISIWIVSLAAIILLVKVGFSYLIMKMGGEKVFGASGHPIEIAQIILSAILFNAQFIIGIFVISILSILLSQEILESKEVLPLISSIAGYLLGRSFKDNFQLSSRDLNQKNNP